MTGLALVATGIAATTAFASAANADGPPRPPGVPSTVGITPLTRSRLSIRRADRPGWQIMAAKDGGANSLAGPGAPH